MMLFRCTTAALLTLLPISLLPVSLCQAKTVEVNPSMDWFGVLSDGQLAPGDEVILAEGVYSNPRRLVVRAKGLPGQPIIIRAASGSRVLLRRPDAKQNTLNLEGCQHVTLRGLEITGGASAIRIRPSGDSIVTDIVLEDLHIHHIGGVAVTCNDKGAIYRNMHFRRNHIHHTSGHGEGFYLGANQGKATFADSVVENNYIHDLNGPQVSQGDGIEIKQGSFGNRIVGNVIHDTNYPGITVYGTAGNARNLIQGNLIWGTGDHGIQAAADAVIRGNFIAQTGGCGIYSREHQGAIPGNLRIENNHVANVGNPAIRLIGNPNGDQPIELIGNTFLGKEDQLVVRIENVNSLIAEANQGQGQLAAPIELKRSWTVADDVQASPPKLDGNPAWQHLDPAALLQRLGHR